tara:strand:- start:169505 stop:169996 length:492 start_codon:yes stop_codon:yes gene_type:complete
MDSVPSIWRTEVLHALSVHLPIVALTLATLLFISSFLIKQNWIKPASQFLLIIGTIGAWIAVFTGDAADGIVSRELCDPRVLKDHENSALTTSFLFTAASIITVAQLFWIRDRFSVFIRVINLILLIVGMSFLLYVGHLGASLVYQQGAGTFQPSEDCSEFVN